MSSGGVTPAAGGGASPGILQVRKDISAATLIASGGTGPIQILAAPGANKIIVPTVLIGLYFYGGTAYTGTPSGTIFVGDTGAAADWFGGWTSIISGTANKISTFDFFASRLDSDSEPFTNTVNKQLAIGVGPCADGNGTFSIFACYTIVDYN